MMAHYRIQKLIILPLLGLVIIPSVSAFPESGVEQISRTITVKMSQISNSQLLLQQGIERYNSEQFSEAINIFEQALTVSQGDRLNQALMLRYVSLAYQHLGRWQEAEKAITQSLQLLENKQGLANTQVYLEVFAKVLNTQGRLQWAKGQFSKALETWKQASVIYKQAGNDRGVIGSLINQAEALQALGLSSQAESELLKVEQVLLQESDANLKATGLQNLGAALRRVGNLKKSREVLQKSWQVAKEFQLLKAESSALLELGNTERALGNQALAIAKPEKEQKHRQSAIAFYHQAANSPSVRLSAQLNLLSLLIETGQWSEAVPLSVTLQQAIANLPPSQTNVYARLNLARNLTCLTSDIDKEALVCIGRDRQEQLSLPLPNVASNTLTTREIAQILTSAIEQSRILKDRKAESYALGQLGGLYEATQQFSAAQELTQQALLLADRIQAADLRYRWEWQLGRLWEKQGDNKKALTAYKQAVKTLNSVRKDLLAINSDVQFSFRDNVEPLHRKLVDLLLRTEGNLQPSQENLQEALGVIDSLRLAELENFLNCNLSQSVQISQDINKVDKQAGFIYPIILEDRLEIIFQLPGQSLRHYVTPVKRTEIEKIALELRENILRRNRPEIAIAKASQIYEWLISPIESDLQKQTQIKTLVFVLDGALRNIPMSVLYDRKREEYLLQKQYAIAMVPGLQLFDLRPLQRQRLNVLAAGVSEKREIAGRLFAELPNVVQEVQQIRTVVPSESLLNPRFTETNLQQQINLGNFSTVHIATHGNFSSDPEETYVLAYNQLLNSNDLNNLLRSNNNSNRSSFVELLVLSACETAKGDNRATLGLAGLTVRAGVRSTLATLWQVSDRSTSALMQQFYKELTKPEVTKAEALHQAQLELFKQYKAPYHWASYVLVGNWL